MIRSKSLALSLAVTLAFAACQRESTPPTDTSANTATANGGYALDESTLPTVVSFDAADPDPGTRACDDFAGYVNGKWLAANEIPADRSQWGGTDVLVERPLAVAPQRAKQASTATGASGIDPIHGHLYSTGTNKEKTEENGRET